MRTIWIRISRSVSYGGLPKPVAFFDTNVGSAHAEPFLSCNSQTIFRHRDVRTSVGDTDCTSLVFTLSLLISYKGQYGWLAWDIFETKAVERVISVGGGAGERGS